MAHSRTSVRAAVEAILLRVLSALTALVFLAYALLISGSDPLLTIPALALLDSGIRTALRATQGGW